LYGESVKYQIISAKLAIIGLGVIIIAVRTFIQFFLNGLTINISYILLYLWIVYIVQIFWFLLAAFLGIINSRKRKIVFAII